MVTLILAAKLFYLLSLDLKSVCFTYQVYKDSARLSIKILKINLFDVVLEL